MRHRPVILIRPRELATYIPYRRNSLKELTKQLVDEGILKKVVLRKGGHAVAYTEESVIAAQKHLMGIDPIEVADEDDRARTDEVRRFQIQP